MVGPSWFSSQWLYESKPACFLREFLERVTDFLLFSCGVWRKVICQNLCWSSRVLSIHPRREDTWSCPFEFNQSITTLESPSSWKSMICNLMAKRRESQAPNNYAFVLVPRPQLRVQHMCEFSVIFMKQPTPQLCPSDWAAPSNQPVGRPSMGVVSCFGFIDFCLWYKACQVVYKLGDLCAIVEMEGDVLLKMELLPSSETMALTTSIIVTKILESTPKSKSDVICSTLFFMAKITTYLKPWPQQLVPLQPKY